ncbi:MAG TPA: phospholipase D-like domain-containing protein [Anaeromyxobacteraceae bacterium]|nr:phospholipase D-like domain-containing protein [Anaeromyxobacteraceae bacterium]
MAPWDAPARVSESVALLDGGREAFPRMLRAIREARQTVRLEVYHFARDGVGEEFLAALSAAARRGVRVLVVLDGWGTALDGRFLEALLERDGCRVRIYNPLTALLAGRLRRNHRKLLLVDGEVLFLGGINIADEYGSPGPEGPADEERRRDWLDLAVEVRGAAAGWLERRLRGSRERPPPGKVHVWLSGLGGARPLRRRYLKAFGAARREILAAHSYFLPDRRFVRSITAAARRGVRVTLLLAGESDVPLARLAARRLYRQLLRAGVEIREWTRSVHHAKVSVVDGGRLILGSFNLDPLSLANLESLLEVDDPSAAAAARLWIEERLRDSRKVELGSLERRSRLASWALDAIGLWVARSAQWVGRLLALRTRAPRRGPQGLRKARAEPHGLRSK